MNLLLFLLMSLIDLLKTDEKRALKEIFSRYQQDIIRFLTLKLSGNRELAEELYQETAIGFIRSVALKKQRFSSDDKIKNYLLTVAYNKLRDNYRRRKSRDKRETLFTSSTDLGKELQIVDTITSSPEESVMEIDQAKKLQTATESAMATLKEGYRQVLELKFTDGLSNPDIAKKMGLSVKAVESLLFRAKKAFKKSFMQAGTRDLYYTMEGEE
jgi:RNA polymerase sigma factor (sigma-70 family)